MNIQGEGVRVESVKDGVKIVWENIRFGPGSDVIAAGEKDKLGLIAAVLKKYPERDIRVVGYASGAGALEELMELSRSRTASVDNQLFGLEPSPPVPGYGVSAPVTASGAGKGMTGRIINHDFRPVTIALFLKREDHRPSAFSLKPDIPS
jgi:outer membrane protein OmpA-like peptidoglycan-associated protein